MKSVPRRLALLVLFFACSAVAFSQSPQPTPKDTSASVSGRVTIGGKPAAGINVVASFSTSFLDTKTVGRTTTDEEGNYHLRGLPGGTLRIMPVAKSLAVGPDAKTRQVGQSVNVAEGEAITKVDFSLVRGAVVTGRITDAEGNPIIGEGVSVVRKDAPTDPNAMFVGGLRNRTDDRGIYRIYGLSPGSYKVSVGVAAGTPGISMMGRGNQYTKTFYPGVQDETKATILELNEGAEVSNIDITPGKMAGGFAVSGRVVDADSGEPMPGVYIAYSPIKDGDLQMGGMNFTGSQTDPAGKFRLENVKPGRYAAYTMGAGQQSTTYSDPASFEMAEGDVSGIEIKVHRGATISGSAVIENNYDPAVAATLKSLVLFAYVAAKGVSAPSYARGNINPDGTFQLTGLAPGKAKINVQGFPAPPKGLSLVRTELDGMDQPDGIELTGGAQVKGVRLVFVYGSGVIRGEVRLEGGTLPEGTNLRLMLRSPASDSRKFNRYVEIDSRNHFLIDSLPPGNYELYLQSSTRDQKAPPFFEPVIRPVTVANAAEVQATIVVNLARKAGVN
ncbi:MAG TPA: carboxypeptidase regulatory-like domain-containing protein [Pyrinomonadaceae bacterium]|nr:carboxypeptidase regulatory-like domain-containing protein [Pyrinomonadaceae bacterium]